jgi:hypothetical protein
MSNKQQTAVEWLVEQLKDMEYDLRLIPNTIEKAKEMEKEQIIKAYENTNSMAMYGEQYYNETFNNKER